MTTTLNRDLSRALICTAVASTASFTLLSDDAHAQSRLQDQAREKSKIVATESVKEKGEGVEESPFRPFLYFETEVANFNNADLRDYEAADPVVFIDVFDTDDRTVVGYSRIGGGFQYDVIDDFTFDAAVSGVGLYGGTGGESAGLFVDRLAFNWSPVNNDMGYVGITVGRVPFNIGGAYKDYFFDDIVDGAIVDLMLNKAGGFRLLADYFASSFRPDDINLVSGTDSGTETIRAEGDSNIWRLGAIYENTTLVKGLELRAFGFYADIGATGPEGTGSSRNFGVLSYGNQADNDYTWMAGGRAGYRLDAGKFNMLTYGEFAQSGGVDREAVQVGLFDVENSGTAFGVGVMPEFKLNTNFGVRAIVHFYYASGAEYAGENGARFNHGFTSMKARQIGGFATDRIAGWHPSAYVGYDGIAHAPHNIERISGTMQIHGGLGFDIIRQVQLNLDFYYFQDTSSTNFDVADAPTASAEVPYGYTEFDLLAQDRFGKTLGFEIDAELRYQPLEFLTFYARGGMFIPGEFYEVTVDRSVGRGGDSRTSLGGTDNFIAGSLGTVVEF